jgi:hypothetical protein
MQWDSDPPNGWTATYRVFVLILLVLTAWHQGRAHPDHPVLEDLVSRAPLPQPLATFTAPLVGR